VPRHEIRDGLDSAFDDLRSGSVTRTVRVFDGD
jgi:hypothetical protein